MAVRDDTFVSALLDEAGGANVFAGTPARYPEVTAAALGAAAPDVVLLSSEPFPFTAAHADEWNTWGAPELAGAGVTKLLAACERVGRDPATMRKCA